MIILDHGFTKRIWPSPAHPHPSHHNFANNLLSKQVGLDGLDGLNGLNVREMEEGLTRKAYLLVFALGLFAWYLPNEITP